MQYEQSHRDYLRSGYLHHRSPSSRAVNHYRDNAITYKAQLQKCQENEAGERGTTDMQMRQRDVAALDAKYTKELADAKAEMMLCVMMLPLVVVGCISSLSVSAYASYHASGVDKRSLPRLADTV